MDEMEASDKFLREVIRREIDRGYLNNLERVNFYIYFRAKGFLVFQ